MLHCGREKQYVCSSDLANLDLLKNCISSKIIWACTNKFLSTETMCNNFSRLKFALAPFFSLSLLLCSWQTGSFKEFVREIIDSIQIWCAIILVDEWNASKSLQCSNPLIIYCHENDCCQFILHLAIGTQQQTLNSTQIPYKINAHFHVWTTTHIDIVFFVCLCLLDEPYTHYIFIPFSLSLCVFVQLIIVLLISKIVKMCTYIWN